jgi:DNA-binding sugar fermentation-stimulating protein
MSKELIYSLGTKLIKAHVIKRPSAHIKTPYVADIDIDGETFLGHTPALGCCGLVEAGCDVWVIKTPGKKCDYRILFASYNEEKDGVTYSSIIGVAPKLAEQIIHNCLRENMLDFLDVHTFKAEQKIQHSRFDFVGNEVDGTNFILEVKNVPLADYVDCPAKERKTMDFSSYPFEKKVSYFPDGYRKTKNAPVSERALKHINHLCDIKTNEPSLRTILMFVIQRSDSEYMQPSVIDPIYRDAVTKASKAGVEIRAIKCEWTLDGECIMLNVAHPVHISK